jgi:NADPH-dependent curcumin reductase CurA
MRPCYGRYPTFRSWRYAARVTEHNLSLDPYGSLRCREDIVDGLENAPEAFIGMLDGKNFGKLLIRV